MMLIQNGTQGPTTPPTKQAAVGTPGYAYGGPPGSTDVTRWDPDVANTLLAESAGLVTAAGMSLDPSNNNQLVTAVPKVVSATANTWSATQTFSVSPVLRNNIYLTATDTSGTTHGLIGYGSDNYAHIFAGPSGLGIQNNAATQNLLTLDNSGNVILSGTANATGMTAQSGSGVGSSKLASGTSTTPGTVEFYNQSGTRVGYVGFSDGSGNLTLESENGFTGWKATGDFTATGHMYAANGTSGSQVVNISQFPGSLGANGYKKVPDPSSPSGYFIYQWGSLTCVNAQPNTVTLPLAFPTVLMQCYAVDAGGGALGWGSAPRDRFGFYVYFSAWANPSVCNWWAVGY